MRLPVTAESLEPAGLGPAIPGGMWPIWYPRGGPGPEPLPFSFPRSTLSLSAGQDPHSPRVSTGTRQPSQGTERGQSAKLK